MKFISTRGDAPAVSLSEALTLGLAPDGGLYLPGHWPAPQDWDEPLPIPEAAIRLLGPFFEGDALQDALPAICREALDLPAPLVASKDPGLYLLELFHGPTAAFKDFAARFLAACLARLRGPSDPVLTILVATSGDTGGAVAAAFHRRPGFRVVVLYPDGKVSARQAHQLGAFGDNVHTFRVAGSFDDCQAMVKAAFADQGLRSQVPLSSANSISLGRLLPQMSYYAAASLRWQVLHAEPAHFVIPTGNLGNALACVLARRLGLPIGEIALAANANRVLPDLLRTGEYRPQPSIPTLANAMDVGAPSNLERLRALHPELADLRAQVSADSVDDDALREVMGHAEERYGHVVCPHTAAALKLIERRRDAGDRRPYVAVATAHPAKFDSVVEPCVGHAVAAPPALSSILERPSRADPLAADADALAAVLRRL
ncbi:threonine synthase [Pseudomarimonas salicorniae]|uniref:Threonine synthase n=1 Tax=Pseudomarimonas salicorniae TaxID=2933270 RepID=A0ABT0GG53_9GAMM|nr:threonine synthase [Lysobacter sp. CAU 1642]MCK7593428.1 threonine synthase [Lysobacter sp. CAU 1642]